MNRFEHDWHNQTTLHPLGLILVLVCGVLTLAAPRKYAIWPLLVVACFVSPAQRLVIATLDFNLLRLMTLFGWARLAMRREIVGFEWRGLDILMVLLPMWRVITVFALSGQTAGLINRLGAAFDVIGMYFLFRLLVRDWEDVKHVVRGLAFLAVPVAFAFALEFATGRNIFAIFGGVPEKTVVRDGRLRCQGAFAHPILAGCFWASVLPLLAIGWFAKWPGKRHAVVGGAAALVIVAACASSTPVLAVAAGILAGSLFVVRAWMRAIRWGAFLLLLIIHVVMEAPVWHLITRIDIVGGSTGYHRYRLISAAVDHTHEWWLVGTKVGTEHWGPQLSDVTNYYIVQGLQGGLLQLGLFVGTIAFGFRDVGRVVRRAGGNSKEAAAAWGLGASLFIHCVSYLSVSYFGQILALWYLLLAMIASLAARSEARAAAPAPARARFRSEPGPALPVQPARMP